MTMTDHEFEVLDELYFIQSFPNLIKLIDLSETQLKLVLLDLLEKEWIKCCLPADQEIPFNRAKFDRDFQNYYYIATKAGLLAHNGKAG